MLDDITIRKIKKTDKHNYFAMSREFYSSGVTNSVISDRCREKFWKEIISGELVKGYILEFNGNIAGYAICALSASQEACGRLLWLDELFVKPEYRGEGIGTKFFTFLENSDEYDFIRLEVEKDNERAMKLYRSLGYKDAQYFSLYKKTRQ